MKLNRARLTPIGLFLAITLAVSMIIFSTQSPKPPTTEDWPYLTESAYIAFTNGTHYFAKNGKTGNIDSISVDAHVAIQYAIDHLTTGRTWKETITFTGTFTIARQINMSSYMHLYLYGAKLTLQNNFPSRSMFYSNGGVTDVVIEGGNFDGNRGNQTTTNPNALVEFAEYSGVANYRIKVKNNIFEDNKHLLLVVGGEDVEVEGNTFKDWGTEFTNAGFYSSHFNDGKVINNYFYNSPCQGIYIGTPSQVADRVTIAYNKIVEVYNAIKLWNAKSGQISNNQIYNTLTTAIAVEKSQDTIVENNQVTFGPSSVNGHGIMVWYDCNGTIVRGNTIRDAYVVGIFIGGNSSLIEGNYIINSGECGIELVKASRNHVVDNVIKNTGGRPYSNWQTGIMLWHAGTDIGSTNNTIRGNRIYDDKTVKTQRWAIYEDGAINDYNFYAENDVRGNLVTPQIRLAGTHSVKIRNLGDDE